MVLWESKLACNEIVAPRNSNLWKRFRKVLLQDGENFDAQVACLSVLQLVGPGPSNALPFILVTNAYIHCASVEKVSQFAAWQTLDNVGPSEVEAAMTRYDILTVLFEHLGFQQPEEVTIEIIHCIQRFCSVDSEVPFSRPCTRNV